MSGEEEEHFSASYIPLQSLPSKGSVENSNITLIKNKFETPSFHIF